MPPIVEVCHAHADEISEMPVVGSDVELHERRCLEHCGICRRRSFVILDGRLVQAPALPSGTGPLPPSESDGD